MDDQRANRLDYNNAYQNWFNNQRTNRLDYNNAYLAHLADDRFNRADADNAYLNFEGRQYRDRNDYLNRLAGMSGSGQSAAGALAGYGANSAANIGNAMTSAANSTALGQLGASNAWTGAANNLAAIYGGYQGGLFDPKPKAGSV